MALAQIGAALSQQPTEVEVRVPRNLADIAIAAWNRHDEGPLDSTRESVDQRRTRHRAGSLALIGAALDERGRQEGTTSSSR